MERIMEGIKNFILGGLLGAAIAIFLILVYGFEIGVYHL
jgi:hypothetical protein